MSRLKSNNFLMALLLSPKSRLLLITLPISFTIFGIFFTTSSYGNNEELRQYAFESKSNYERISNDKIIAKDDNHRVESEETDRISESKSNDNHNSDTNNNADWPIVRPLAAPPMSNNDIIKKSSKQFDRQIKSKYRKSSQMSNNNEQKSDQFSLKTNENDTKIDSELHNDYQNGTNNTNVIERNIVSSTNISIAIEAANQTDIKSFAQLILDTNNVDNEDTLMTVDRSNNNNITANNNDMVQYNSIENSKNDRIETILNENIDKIDNSEQQNLYGADLAIEEKNNDKEQNDSSWMIKSNNKLNGNDDDEQPSDGNDIRDAVIAITPEIIVEYPPTYQTRQSKQIIDDQK